MNEAFLAYIWKFQYFDKQNLRTSEGEIVNILRVGVQNSDAGADFQQAHIEINGQLWIGSIEIHLTDKDWTLHQHSQNKQYNNVILHLVGKKLTQQNVLRADGTPIPTLAIQDRISPILQEKYHKLLVSKELIPCQNSFKSVSELQILSMLDNVLVRRLQRKSQAILDLLVENTGNWEETTYQTLAQSFGFKVNNEAFLALAKSLPFKILQKHSHDITELEALLFGQAGFLTQPEDLDEYTKDLSQKYAYLKYKYGLVPLEVSRWKFLRLRPANFPTIRIAQFAALIYQENNFFSNFIHTENAKSLQKKLGITTSDYWISHYNFCKSSSRKMGHLGEDSVNNLIINTIAPVLAAYSTYKEDDSFIEKAVKFLEQLPAESNKITAMWEDIGLKTKNSFDAQASIELYNEFCSQKKCLSCKIGATLLK